MLLRHPLLDPTEFGSLTDLHGVSSHEGYQACPTVACIAYRHAYWMHGLFSAFFVPFPDPPRIPDPAPCSPRVGLDSQRQGGLRLMQATCKKFFEFCCRRGGLR